MLPLQEDDEFLVLACDGIYDVLENDELCSLIRSRLSVTRDLKTAMNQVLDVCLSKGSRDNMTLILVLFDNSPKINEELVEKEKEWLEKVENKIHGELTREVASPNLTISRAPRNSRRTGLA